MYGESALAACDTTFPAAVIYDALRMNAWGNCVEESLPKAYAWSERHLQCVWYDDALRPQSCVTAMGEPVRVLSPGVWNLEAGPDFLNAVLEIGGARCRGDVEVHIHPSDWDAHRHASNAAYRRVIAHVTWFSGPPPRSLPPRAHAIALGESVLARSDFSMDDVDLTAYPYAVIGETPRPCYAIYGRDPDRALALLRAAGQHRLRAKTRRIAESLARTGDRRQVFYEEIMAALGYKRNSAPFRAVAKMLPWHVLGPDRATVLARLLGTAGLLPSLESAADDEARAVIRALWDAWWRVGGASIDQTMTPWTLHGIRPQNAPVRRLVAAAALFGEPRTWLDALARLDVTHVSGMNDAVMACRDLCRWPFWEAHLTAASRVTPRQTTLLGTARIAAMLANVIVPFAVAEGRISGKSLDFLLPEDISEPMRRCAHRLFGRDHNPALYAGNGLLQQGLLQIERDFCLSARPACAGCPLGYTSK